MDNLRLIQKVPGSKSPSEHQLFPFPQFLQASAMTVSEIMSQSLPSKSQLNIHYYANILRYVIWAAESVVK
jgi:hypothetical protein